MPLGAPISPQRPYEQVKHRRHASMSMHLLHLAHHQVLSLTKPDSHTESKSQSLQDYSYGTWCRQKCNYCSALCLFLLSLS